VVPAFQKLLTSYPDALLLLANANGNYSTQIQLLLQNVPHHSYVEISFEPDIFTLYHLFDIFVHVPIDPSIEAYGQTYVEALAAGIPSVFTLSGVASEFIEHHKNAWVVSFKNTESIFDAMQEILADTVSKKQIVEQGKRDVFNRYTLQRMISNLENLYEP
jgi:glycosyltransferase involved in cell wall biosynthesis